MALSGAKSREIVELGSDEDVVRLDPVDVAMLSGNRGGGGLLPRVSWSRNCWHRSRKPGYLLMTLPSQAMVRLLNVDPPSRSDIWRLTSCPGFGVDTGLDGISGDSVALCKRHMLWMAVARYAAARWETKTHICRKKRTSDGDGGTRKEYWFWRYADEGLREGDVSASMRAATEVSKEYGSRREGGSSP